MHDGDDFVWFPDPAMAHLLGCWLRGRPAGRGVTILAPPAIHALAEETCAACPGVTATVEAAVPGDALPARLRARMPAAGAPEVTVPISLEQVPMRYRPTLMPAVPPHYDLLRQLWQWGFRAVVFAGLQGGHRLSIPYLLDAFQGIHQGQRCFVVGNGPSLNAIDMTRLKDEITLGSNRCFLGYETWGFPFTYWGVYDKYQIESYHAEYEAHIPADTVKFFPVEYLPALHVANGCPVNVQWPAGAPRAFSAAPDRTYAGFTVTYMLIQVAACMGCDPIILIGADHRYELTRRGYVRALRAGRRALARRMRGGRLYEAAQAAHRAWRRHGGGESRGPALWSTGDAASATHFTDRYTAGGKNRFLPPEPEEAERDFDCAHAWARAQGRRIINATPGSALESFPTADFDSLF